MKRPHFDCENCPTNMQCYCQFYNELLDFSSLPDPETCVWKPGYGLAHIPIVEDKKAGSPLKNPRQKAAIDKARLGRVKGQQFLEVMNAITPNKTIQK